MPEQPASKLHVPAPSRDLPAAAIPPVRYVELRCKTNFSFLEGASHPDELVNEAVRLGYAGMAVTDRNSLSGVVRAHVAARKLGFKLVIGAEVTPGDASPVLLWAMNRAWLRPALPALDARPDAGKEGRVPPWLRRRRRARRRPLGRCPAPFEQPPRSITSSGARSLVTEPMPWPSCIAAHATAAGWRVATRGQGRARTLGRRRRRSLPRRPGGVIFKMC